MFFLRTFSRLYYCSVLAGVLRVHQAAAVAGAVKRSDALNDLLQEDLNAAADAAAREADVIREEELAELEGLSDEERKERVLQQVAETAARNKRPDDGKQFLDARDQYTEIYMPVSFQFV